MQKQKDKLADFGALLEKKGLKLTYERKRICEEVRRLKEHFDADGLYERFKKQRERIARATVYRTLPLLLECGVLQKSAGSSKRDFFERTSSKGHHDHMVCIHCGKIIEFRSDSIEKAQARACEGFEFKLVFHDHRLFGYCKNCQ
ncbi:MAG: transcriptional repressor [Candidatus Omnitrophica bacterium]|nr:transcriptional repressor [Candidatus Omnitrophota bacterium]